jgi:hypothetical protein
VQRQQRYVEQEPEKPPSLFQLARRLRNPEIRRGMGRALNTLSAVVEVDTTQPMFWLERYDRSDAGVFGGDPAVTGLGTGEYIVEFTSYGETMFEERFTIVEP